EAAHQLGGGDTVLELLRVRVELEYAALQVIVDDARARTERVQAFARIEREIHALHRVALRARGQAFEQELQHPAPLRRIGAQSEQDRRVVLPEPAQDLPRRGRVRPRLGVRRRDLAAV